MLEVRRSDQRGFADHGWLQSYHSFSFADYYDPANMGFSALRVINDDTVAPGTGFGMHGHRDMEIITYILEGALAHKDNMGNGSVIRPGDVQRMSAGTGVLHSEFNHEKAAATHLLQIWIEPDQRGIRPGYEEKHFSAAEKRGRLRLIGSHDAREGSVRIHQQTDLYAGLFDGEEEQFTLPVAAGRRLYLHLAQGELTVNGQRLHAGDAITLTGEAQLELRDGKQAEVLVFDLP